MTSPLPSSPLDTSFPFRKESLGEEDSPLDVEIAQVIEELRLKHPDCDRFLFYFPLKDKNRLGEINTIVAHCRQKLKECVENKDTINRTAYMEKIVQLGLEKQSLEVE